MSIKEKAQAIIVATAKGAIGLIPGAGSFLTEYVSLVQEGLGKKAQQEWRNLVEERLEKLNCQMSDLANNEMFFSAIQIATAGAMKTHQREKREYFANALINTVRIEDMTEEKKLIFFSLLDRYTLLSIRLLDYFSKDHNPKHESPTINPGTPGIWSRTVIFGGTEHLTKHIFEMLPEFRKESELLQTLTSQMTADGLIEGLDFRVPVSPECQ